MKRKSKSGQKKHLLMPKDDLTQQFAEAGKMVMVDIMQTKESKPVYKIDPPISERVF